MLEVTARPKRRIGLKSLSALGMAAVMTAGFAAPVAFADPHGSNTAEGRGTSELTVSPAYDLATEGESTLSLTGTGYATQSDFGTSFGGAYVLFGVVTPVDPDDPTSWGPSQRGVAGVNYDYAAGAGTYQSMVNYPANTTEPGYPYMDEEGNWSLEDFPIPGPVFTSQMGNEIDCFEQQCGVITIGAHGQRSEGTEAFTPVYFQEPVVETAPEFTTQPVDVTVDEGESAAFTVAVTGEPAPELQWQTRADAEGEWIDVSGETSDTLTIDATTLEQNGAQFRAVATSSAGTTNSSTATLTVNEIPAEAIVTTTTVAAQLIGDFPTYFLGQEETVTATVAPADAAGSVEFFDGETSLGTAAVVDGSATVTTDAWAAGGRRSITATFTPDDAEAFTESTSAARQYVVIDLARTVDDIELGDVTGTGEGAQLDWTIANMYNSFGYWFDKQAVDGNVTVQEVDDDAGAYELTNRLFHFTEGSVEQDAAGNTIISFEGTARVTSGSANTWNFKDVQVHVNANGDGYITAEFSGFFRIEGLAEYDYGPTRVTVATFNGADVTADADGVVEFEIAPNWEGETDPGTWGAGFDASYPNEFTSLLYSGIRSFFYGSGSSADEYKKPRPFTLSYSVEQVAVAPSIVSGPTDVSVTEGDDVTLSATVDGSPEPTVQWQQLVDGEWVDVEGADSTEYVFTAGEEHDGAQFRVVATNEAGTAESDAATVTVEPAEEPAPEPEEQAPVFLEQPQDVTAAPGEEVVLSAVVEAAPAPNAQWQVRTGEGEWSDIGDEIVIDAAADALAAVGTQQESEVPAYELTLTFDAIEELDGAEFRVIASNEHGESISETASLTVTADSDDSGTDDPGSDDSGSDDQGGDSGSNDADNDGSNTLPRTGGDLSVAAGILAVLMLLGGGLLAARRIRNA